eukprot:162389_1
MRALAAQIPNEQAQQAISRQKKLRIEQYIYGIITVPSLNEEDDAWIQQNHIPICEWQQVKEAMEQLIFATHARDITENEIARVIMRIIVEVLARESWEVINALDMGSQILQSRLETFANAQQDDFMATCKLTQNEIDQADLQQEEREALLAFRNGFNVLVMRALHLLNADQYRSTNMEALLADRPGDIAYYMDNDEKRTASLSKNKVIFLKSL